MIMQPVCTCADLSLIHNRFEAGKHQCCNRQVLLLTEEVQGARPQSAILLSGSTVTLGCLVEQRLRLESAEDPTKVCCIRPDFKDSKQKQGKASKSSLAN